MRKWICVAMIAAAAGLARAEVGELTPSDGKGQSGLTPLSRWVESEAFEKASDGDGTVHPSAVVAVAVEHNMIGERVKVAIAIDATSPDAKSPDIVRIDFTGTKAFGGKPTLPLTGKTERGSFSGEIGSGTFVVEHNDRLFPVSVAGQYWKFGPRRNVSLSLTIATEGSCVFGKKVLPVILFDGGGDFKMNAAAKMAIHGQNEYVDGAPDTVAIGLADGVYARSYYGQPVMVDGAWYNVIVSADGRKVTAEPTPLKTAYIKINQQKWEATLVSADHILHLSGGPEPVPVPAGEYRIHKYHQDAVATEATRVSLDSAGTENSRADTKRYAVAAGKTIEIAAGLPIALRVNTQVKRKTVSMSLTAFDAGAMEISDVQVGGQPPEPPSIEVRDAAGKVVHTGQFEYG